MHLTRPDGVNLWYEVRSPDDADAPTAILLPGRGDSTDVFPPEFTAELVAAGLRVIRFDPRETGLSSAGGDEYSMATMADDAAAVLDAAVGNVPAHWVGMSMAGLHLIDIATRCPERVTSLAFLSAISPDPDAGFGEHFFAEFGSDAVSTMVDMMGEVSDTDRDWAAVRVARALERAPARPEAGSAHMAAVARSTWPTESQLTEIHAPTLVVHGTVDRTLPLDHAKALARIPGAELLIRKGMGHFPRPVDWAAIACEIEAMAKLAERPPDMWLVGCA